MNDQTYTSDSTLIHNIDKEHELNLFRNLLVSCWKSLDGATINGPEDLQKRKAISSQLSEAQSTCLEPWRRFDGKWPKNPTVLQSSPVLQPQHEINSTGMLFPPSRGRKKHPDIIIAVIISDVV